MMKPSGENSGEEQQGKKPKELQLEQRERMPTEDHNAGITESSSQVERGEALPRPELLWNDSPTVTAVRLWSLEIERKLISLSLLARSSQEMSDLSDSEEQKYLELEQLAELQKNKDELVQRTDQAAAAWCLAIEEYCGSKGGDVGKLDAAFVSVSSDLDLLGVEWVAQKTNLAVGIQDARAKKIQAVRDFIKSNFGPDFATSRAKDVRVSTNRDDSKPSNNLERHQVHRRCQKFCV